MEAAVQTAADAEKWIALMKQYVNPGFTLLCLFQLRSLLFLRRVSFPVAGIEQPFQQLVLVLSLIHILQLRQHFADVAVNADRASGKFRDSFFHCHPGKIRLLPCKVRTFFVPRLPESNLMK